MKIDSALLKQQFSRKWGSSGDFILLLFSAILIHRWLPGSRNLKKSVHLCLQGLALGSGVFGIWTKFHGKDGIVANFYSLHSWMGLICVCLFAAQVLLFNPSYFTEFILVVQNFPSKKSPQLFFTSMFN